jgi:predicted metal-dependent phosphoesterase TrpH
MDEIYRGSEWRKWDLHFHTPSSYDYQNGSITNQDIIDGLFANNISVVAITDHHIIDIPRIKELQQLGKEKGITVLPGIEFLAELRDREPIHYIGIFSEDANLRHYLGTIRKQNSPFKHKE